MVIKTADAEWRGNLAQGSGHIRLVSGAFEGPYDFRSRPGDGNDTDPEELLGGAYARCSSMVQAPQLANGSFTVKRGHATMKVHFDERDGGSSIHGIDIDTEASVSDVVAVSIEEQAQSTTNNCPGVASSVRRRHSSMSQTPWSFSTIGGPMPPVSILSVLAVQTGAEPHLEAKSQR